MSTKQAPEGALRGKMEGRSPKDARKAACEVLSDCICVKTIRGHSELEQKRGAQGAKGVRKRGAEGVRNAPWDSVGEGT